MTDEEFQLITGFIKSAVDTAEERFEERFGKPIMARLDGLDGDVRVLKGDVLNLKGAVDSLSYRMTSLESKVGDGFYKLKTMEYGDISAVLHDIDKLKKTDISHGNRITALEKARG